MSLTPKSKKIRVINVLRNRTHRYLLVDVMVYNEEKSMYMGTDMSYGTGLRKSIIFNPYCYMVIKYST